MISDYFLLTISLFTLLLSVYFTGLLFQKIELLKLIAISISIFFTGYVLCSSIYFWLDRFQFISVLLTECVCFAIGIIALVTRNKKFLFTAERKQRSMWIYAIILSGILLSVPKFSFFGMGQDEGVYQTKAIALAYGYSQRQFDFEEYQLLETNEQRETYDAVVKRLVGLDRYDVRKPTLSEEGKLSPVSGIFHGIPTFPAVLGLMVKIFDVSAMQHVQSIFLLCSLLFALFTVENLNLKMSSQYLSLSILAFSPIVQWVMKSALTEGFLVLIFAWFIFHMTDQEHQQSRLLSALPICAFSFWHVSVFTIIPLFVCLYMIAYEETKSRVYIHAGVLALIFFLAGSAMMMYVSPTYTSNNIIRNGFSFLTDFQIMPAFLFACILLILLLLFIDKIRFHEIYKWITQDRVFSYFLRGIMLISLAAIIWFTIGISTGTHISTTSRYASGLSAIPHLTILVFAFGTGVISLPICMIFIFCSPAKVLRRKEILFLTSMFIYCVVLMAAFLRKEIPHSYYYARYLAPFIVVCSVMASVTFNEIPEKANMVALICSLVFLLPYDWVLFSQKDDSRMEWSVLSEIASSITKDSAVVFDSAATFDSSPIYRVLMIPIKTITEADVYPMFENEEEQMDFLISNYEDIFVLTTDLTGSNLFSQNREEFIYINKYIASEDLGSKRAPTSQFPLEFTEQTIRIGLLKYCGNKLEYDLSQEDTACSGFGVIENSNFRWSTGDATLPIFLSKKDYLMSITPGPGIPLSQLGRESVEINVTMNDHLVNSFQLTHENMNREIRIIIPGKYLEDGKNILTFYGETWSPSDYGINDGRRVLFSVSKITFAEMDLSTYDFGEQEYFNFSGFSGNEGSFRWTNESPAEINTFSLDSNYDYQCTIELGPLAPIGQLDLDTFYVEIVVNGNTEDSINFELAPEQKNIDFEIDKELLNNEENVIQIYTPLWSPLDYGSSDARTLGISIDKINFIPEESNP